MDGRFVSIPLADRFAAKFFVEPNSGCWLWTGTKKDGGYGVIERGGSTRFLLKAHRVSYELHKGPIPEGLCVLHSCDTPACVNPAHLRVGTHADNAADRIARKRGRNVRGVNHPHAKLNSEKVAHIRRHEMSGCKYAALYGVSRKTIYEVLYGKTWK